MQKIKKLLNTPERVFLIIAGFFGLLSACLMPVLATPDENQHFQVSYAMLSANKGPATDLIVLSEDVVINSIRNDTYKYFFTAETSAAQDGFAINTGSKVFNDKVNVSIFDIMHLPQAFGIAIGKAIYPSIGVMVLMGRLATLAFYLTALFFIIKKLRYGKWAFVLVSTFPMIIQQVASLSYDPINFVAIFAWVAFVINLITQQTAITKRQILLGIALAIFLLISKPNNVLFFALLLALPASQVTQRGFFQKIRAHKHWSIIKYTGLLAAGVILLVGLYILSVKLLAGHEFHPRQLAGVLANTFFWGNLALIDVTTIGIIGQFSNFYYHLPIWVIIGAFSVFAIILLAEKIPRISKRFAIISGLLFFGSIVLISIGMYYGWAMRPERLGPGADVTDGIQGRYFTPLLVLLIPVAAYLQKYVKVVTQSPYFIPALASLTSILLLTFYLVQTVRFFLHG